jgi:hypothetical protein
MPSIDYLSLCLGNELHRLCQQPNLLARSALTGHLASAYDGGWQQLAHFGACQSESVSRPSDYLSTSSSFRSSTFE